MKLFKLFFVLGSISFLAACGKIGSESVHTGDMYFTMAIQNPSGTGKEATVECYARVSVDEEFGSSVDLEGEDYLNCNDRRMHRQETIGEYVYYATRVPAKPGDSVTIRFHRGNIDFNSTASVVSSFEILSPESLEAHFNESLNLHWRKSSTSQEEIFFTLSASIPSADGLTTVPVSSLVTQAPETGSIALPPLSSRTNLSLREDVPLKLSVTKFLRGHIASGLSGHIDSKGATYQMTGTLHP